MRKTLWVVVSCLMVLSLVLAACGPAATTTPTTTTTTTPTTSAPTPITTTPATTPEQAKAQKEALVASSEVPKYGGTFTMTGGDPVNWDAGAGTTGGALGGLVYQQFTSSDWMRGPAGSGVTNFAAGANGLEDYGNQVAESW